MRSSSDLVAPFRLEIKDLGDRRREITYEADSRDGTRNQVTTLWTHKRYFTHRETVYKNVYLDESTGGQLRVVKEILNRDASGSRCLELEAAARIARDVKNDQAHLFVEFLGWFEVRNGISLVLEYCALGDIDQFFPEPVAEHVARTVAGQLLEGIAVLHRMGIAHRDIKPQNVLVANAEPIMVKIADFGVSKSTTDQTNLRSRVGTPEYMAPELLFDARRESKYSNAVDIWSLGCLLFYMLTKQPAFPGFRELDEYYTANAPYPETVLISHGVGSSARRLIKLLMSPSPDDRPQASKGLLVEWEIGIEGAKDADSQPTGTSNAVAAEGAFPQVMDDASTFQLPMDYWSSELLSATATPNGDSRRTRALLESGADPNRIQNGCTALHHAAMQGSTETVRILLEYGADTWVKTKVHDETALHLATHRGDCEAFLDVLHLLVARGVDINAQDATGNTVLHLAIARLASPKPVETLLELGARTDLLGRGGLTPLQYAMSLDREDKTKALLDGGADPNIPSPDGRRPLHRAVDSERISLGLVGQLVERGADVNAKDDNGHTPLDEAVRRGRTTLVDFLIDHGADSMLGSTQMKKRLQWMQLKRGLPWPLGR